MKKLFKKNSDTQSSAVPNQSFKRNISLVILLALVLFSVSGYFWYKNVFTNPDRVLNDVLGKSLQTSSIDRTVTQDGGTGKVSQSLFIGFTPQVVAQSVTNLEEEAEIGKTTVVTETLGTKDSDYVRYRSIEIANNPTANDRFKGAINTWAQRKSDKEKGENVSFLNDALFVAVPFGNFNADQRKAMKEEIKRVNLYKSPESKLKWQSGRPVMEYTMQVSPQSLVSVLAKYSSLSGIGNASEFNPSQYDGVPDITIVMNVDVLSRHVKTIDYQGTNRLETYTAYNSRRSIELPTKTIGIDELQSKISGAEQQQSSGQ